jgi:hypothetical protein
MGGSLDLRAFMAGTRPIRDEKVAALAKNQPAASGGPSDAGLQKK